MADSTLAPEAPAASDPLSGAAPETVALNTAGLPATGLPAAAPGTNEDLFTFWPRHNAAIYQALADRHTQVEVNRGTNPLDADTDRDGFPDGAEVAVGTDPLDFNDNPAPNL